MITPNNVRKILLHSCCAPCSGGIIRMLLDSDIPVTIFFYNPNIYPLAEYEKRKGEITRYAQKFQIPFVDADYDPENWQAHVKGLENEPEKGKRCDRCFLLRLGQTARYAEKNHFPVFATTLTVSRWKDSAQVNAAGQQAADLFPKTTFWAQDWKKDGGTQIMEQIARQENFYRQKYCGCIYSQNAKILSR